MVANYTELVTTTEQDVVSKIDDFLVNHVGWYRIDTISDTASDRDYVYMSDGEPDKYENTNPRIVRIRGLSNYVSVYTYATYPNFAGRTQEVYDTTYSRIGNAATDCTIYVIADKERIIITPVTATSRYSPSYVGRAESFHTSAQHPYPNIVKGSYVAGTQWAGTAAEDRAHGYTPTTVERYYLVDDNSSLTEIGKLSRNGKYVTVPALFYSPELSGDYDIMGRARGVYQISRAVSPGSYVTLASGVHMALPDSGQTVNWVYGPLTDPRIGDINRIPPSVATVDYTYRGLSTDINTIANWRLDSEENGFYVDETGDYDLVPANSPVLENSPLVRCVHLNGSTQRATVSGTVATPTDLSGEWTCEIIFNPDTIPGGTATLLEFGTNSDGTESENTLLSISIVSGSDVNVLWEHGAAGTDESNTTSSGFVEASRWNYLSVVKKDVGGSNYDIEVWHAGFSDHGPVLRETFSSVPNSTGGGDSFWFLGVGASLTNYFDGKIDAIRVQKEALTETQMVASFRRTRL